MIIYKAGFNVSSPKHTKKNYETIILRIMTTCTSCETLYIVLSHTHITIGGLQAMWWRKIQSEIEVYDRLWTSNAAPVACLFLLKIMPFYDEILLSGQPPPGVQNTKTNDDIRIRRKRLSCVMESFTFFDQSSATIITTYSQSIFLKLGTL